MQQTLAGCVFCDARHGTETGEAHTWGQDERISHPVCVDCAIQTRPDPDERDRLACDSCGLVADALAASPAFHAGFQRDLRSRPAHAVPGGTGHLEAPLQLCARCSPGGPATYWTRHLEEHLVGDVSHD